MILGAVLTIVVVLVTACGSAANAPPTVSDSRPTPTDASATARPSATAPEATEEPEATTDAYPQPAIVAVDGLNVRSGAGPEHPVVEDWNVDVGIAFSVPVQLSTDDVVMVLEPAVDAADGQWARVAVNFAFYETRTLIGWVNVGPPDDPWIRDFDEKVCPEVVDGYGEFWHPSNPLATLACYGSRSLRIEGELTPTYLYGGELCGPTAWQWCSNQRLSGFDVWVDLAAVGSVPAEGSLATAVGHFDDHRAAECAVELAGDEATAAVLECRTRFVVDEIISPPPVRGAIGSPAPILEFLGTETYADGAWTRYRFRIANAAAYDQELFAEAPDLEPCGGLDSAGRTWVVLRAQTGHEIGLLCAPHPDLDELTTPVRTGEEPPTQVSVDLVDRAEGTTYRSEPITIGE